MLSKRIPVANSEMAGTQLKRLFCFFMVLFSTHVLAAGNTLIPNDSNSRITVENAVIDGNETTVFFFTWPDIGDPNSGKPCPLNYYSVTLKPGLPFANADVVAKGVCGGLFQKSRLLDNGVALIIVRDRLERWRRGEQINSQTFSSIDAVSKLGVTTDMMGGQFYDISPNGDVVLLIQSGDHTYDRNEYRDSSMVMSGLKPDGGRRWEERFSGDPTLTTVKQVWAAPGGSALLYMSSLANGLADFAWQLHFISADGSRKSIELNKTEEPLDPQSLNNMSPEEWHLYSIGPDGRLLSDTSLGNQIVEHGLERWFGFYLESEQLVLLSSAAVTQKVVRKVKKKWGQNIVSWIDLDTGTPTARMIPLDEQYLEAALNAGDEGQQYLEGQPGSEPALLTTLGGKPLVISVGWISHRQVLRLNEADEHLVVYTEAFDEKQAKLAKDTSRKQRKANREASKQRMNADMAAAVGMTPEEYAALSNKERKEVMIRNGDMDAMMAVMTKQAQELQQAQGTQQGSPAQPAAMPPDMNAQIAAAMAQAQEQIANDPNMTPEMRAQMAAIMAQIGQGPGGQSTAPSSMPAAQSQTAAARGSSSQKVLPENTLKVDSGKRGFIKYENKDGRLVTLLIFNRQTDEELLKKDYPDGVIYEYVDFSRFNLPLQHIGVIYREVNEKILEDLTPVVSQ